MQSSANPCPIASIPGLYISDITVPSSPVQLQDHGITHVLTLLSTPKRPQIPPSLNITHKIIEIDDDALADLLGVLEEACTFIASALTLPATKGETVEKDDTRESRVLVHCLQGLSRSGAIIVAYTMKFLSLSYTSALALARKHRAVIAPNAGFAEQLHLWERMEYSVWEEGGEDGRKEKDLYKEWKDKRDKVVESAEKEMRVWQGWREGSRPEGW